ncbi:MAG: SIMPL domain-containing protein [Pseudomonadota bacterium]
MLNWCVGAVIAVALACAAPGVAGAQGGGERMSELTVRASGRVEAEPDMATITLGVAREAETAEAAVAAMSEAAGAMLAALEAAGLESRDVQTSGLSLQPRWRQYDRAQDRPPEIVGYVASTDVTVRVRDLEALGGLLDTVVGEGANAFRGLSFGLQEPEPVQDAARVEAVREGRARAELLAEAAGVTLGRLISLSEESDARPMPMMRAEMAMSDGAGVPVAQGELVFSATVLMRFEMLQE